MCNAYVTGNHKGSQIVKFSPGKMTIQEAYSVRCDTAGSVHLIMQMLLPSLVFTPVPTTLNLSVKIDCLSYSRAALTLR
jgi:RNA 3'-terminal phosphate cyclase